MNHPTREDVLTLIAILIILAVGIFAALTSGCTQSHELLPTEGSDVVDLRVQVLQRGGHFMGEGTAYVETSVLCLQGCAVMVTTYGASVSVVQLWESADQPVRCGADMNVEREEAE
jgi:hypothetical protein